MEFEGIELSIMKKYNWNSISNLLYLFILLYFVGLIVAVFNPEWGFVIGGCSFLISMDYFTNAINGNSIKKTILGIFAAILASISFLLIFVGIFTIKSRG